jgi:hypothetical protein
MAKASNTSDRNSRENSLLISERPCTCGCGGTMKLVVKAKGWKSMWACDKCGHEQSKTKGDYPLKEALALKAAEQAVVDAKKACKKVPEGDEAAAIDADIALGVAVSEVKRMRYQV